MNASKLMTISERGFSSVTFKVSVNSTKVDISCFAASVASLLEIPSWLVGFESVTVVALLDCSGFEGPESGPLSVEVGRAGGVGGSTESCVSRVYLLNKLSNS